MKRAILVALLALMLPAAALASRTVHFGNSGGGLQGSAAGLILTGSTKGHKGIPNAVLFSGTFSIPVTWTLITLPEGTHNYTLTGTLSGTLIPGYPATGVTIQPTINTGKGYFDGKLKRASNDPSIVVPEPGTLGLLGTGLLAIAGLVRRRKRGS